VQFRKLTALAAIGWLVATCWPNYCAANSPSRGPRRRALLVGCTDYQLPSVGELWGPANDIPMWEATLVKWFGFPESDVCTLVGWPNEEAQRPTYANIKRAIEVIISRSQADDEVVIVLSGHGSQIPVLRSTKDGLIEADGFDEVFLPADVQSWTSAGIKNGILDDEIGNWLDQLQQKGAHVWIIFDCCHAAGLAKRHSSQSARVAAGSRVVSFQHLEIPEHVIRESTELAKTAAARAKAEGRPVATEHKSGWIDRPIAADSITGTVVAFYACRGTEEAPSLPRPPDAERVKENYFGLFSYNILAALSRQGTITTYRKLLEDVESRYESERPGLPPRVCIDGAIDRRVLGLTALPKRPEITLEVGLGNSLTVNAGELMGLTQESILSVIRDSDGHGRKNDSLGFLKVKKLFPTSAIVETTKVQGFQPVEGQPAYCEIVPPQME
jgi:hypothetical protein